MVGSATEELAPIFTVPTMDAKELSKETMQKVEFFIEDAQPILRSSKSNEAHRA